MSYRSYINIDESKLDKPVYRIMPIHRTLEALEKKELILVKPKKWDDPFESSLLSVPVVTSQGEKGELSAKESVYGQCWTRMKYNKVSISEVFVFSLLDEKTVKTTS